ncbi:MAG TPA: RNHCP domain-containing protein [Patescibacteria group bacterium]
MKLFQRRKENFTCGHCGFKVMGTGYTNHCPKCLYSKHVDINPGDRKEICQGLMEPIGFEQNHGEYTILHKCLNCGFLRKNKADPGDDFNQIIALTK